MQRCNNPMHWYKLGTNWLKSSSVDINLAVCGQQIWVKKAIRILSCISKSQMVQESDSPFTGTPVELCTVLCVWSFWSRLHREAGDIFIPRYNHILTGQDLPASDLTLKSVLKGEKGWMRWLQRSLPSYIFLWTPTGKSYFASHILLF